MDPAQASFLRQRLAEMMAMNAGQGPTTDMAALRGR
jgi:hypothetical protein